MLASKLVLIAALLVPPSLTSAKASAATCVAGGTACVRQVLELALGDDNSVKHSLTFAPPLLSDSTVLVFKLTTMKLHTLAKGLREIVELPPDRQLAFEDQLGILVDQEWSD